MKPKLRKAVYSIIIFAALLSAATIYLNQANKPDQYDAEVKKLFEEVKADVTKLRNLTTTEPIVLKIVDKHFFERKTEEETDALKAAREALYKALLLAPQDFSIRSYEREKAGLVLAASSAYTLYIVKDYLNPSSEDSKRLLAHEYVHILQYGRVKQPQLISFDSQLAWSAFVEGEADLVADLYTSNKTGRISLTQPQFEQPGSWSNTLLIDRLTYFPYIFGERFAYALYLAGGWAGLDQAHLNPPSSTAEIMNPQLYLSGYKPIYPQNPAPPTSGWSIYYPDVLGAYFFNLFLTRTIGSADAPKIASYWSGDNSTLYLAEKDHLLYWQINFSNAEQAEMVDQMLTESLLKESSTKDGEILHIDGLYVTVLHQGSKLLIVSASSLNLAEEALGDLFAEGFI